MTARDLDTSYFSSLNEVLDYWDVTNPFVKYRDHTSTPEEKQRALECLLFEFMVLSYSFNEEKDTCMVL